VSPAAAQKPELDGVPLELDERKSWEFSWRSGALACNGGGALELSWTRGYGAGQRGSGAGVPES